MSKRKKVLLKILSARSDKNIPFEHLCYLLETLGFDSRVRGSHHIFFREGVEEILNLQPKGKLSKPYQVRQVRDIVLRYKLTDDLES